MKLKSLKNPIMSLSVTISSYFLTSVAHATTTTGSLGQGTSFDDVSNVVGSQIYSATNLLSTGSYIAGAGFTMGGLLSLKKHGETPGQEPIHKGVSRIAVGAGLVGLPFVINTAMNSVGADDAGVGISGNQNRL